MWGGLKASEKPTYLRSTMQRVSAIMLNALRTDTFLATSVKYSCALLCPWTDANSSPSMKDHESASPRAVEWVLLTFVRQMSQVSPKSTHAGGRKVG